MNRLNVALGVFAAVCAAVCLYLFHQLRLERRQIAELRTHVQAETTALRGSHVDPPPDDASKNEAARAMVPVAEDSTRVDTKGGVLKHAPPPSSPRYRQARHALERALVEQRNPELARALGLAPKQTNELLDLLADNSVREVDVFSEKDDGATQRRRAAEARARLEADIAATLGKDKLEQWKRYETSLPARELVGQLRTALATSGDPLREDQADSMIDSIVQERGRHAAIRTNLYDESASWTTTTTSTEKIAYMQRRQDAINDHLDRLREIGSTFLDADQQMQFDVLLSRSRDYARAEFEMWLASEDAAEP